MPELFGKNLDRASLLRRVGNMAQVAGIREFVYASGRAAGVRAVEVNTGPLRFEILPDRCMDISFASFKGVPFSYISKSGVRHPAYYIRNDPGGFADNFLAGALSTCGLSNIGPGSETGGRQYGLHGDVGNIPAEKVSVGEGWHGDECSYAVSGEMHHSSFYGQDLILRRRITATLGGTAFRIEDEVENLDFAPAPCLILYHAQFGYPFLDTDTGLISSPRVESRARAGVPEALAKEDFTTFVAPEDGRPEACFLHTFKPDAKGWAGAALFNPRLGERGMGVYVRYDTATLPQFVQWKMLRSREYVCGLEPGSAPLDGRDDKDMAASTLQPLEKRRYTLEIGVVEGEDACRSLMEQ